MAERGSSTRDGSRESSSGAPDYQIEVREDVLVEKDGPMLLHGLRGFHGATLRTPRSELLKPKSASR